MTADEVGAALRALRDALARGDDTDAATERVAALLDQATATADLDAFLQALLDLTEATLDEVGPILGPLRGALAEEARRGGAGDELAPLIAALRPDVDLATLGSALRAASLPVDPDGRALRAAIAELTGDERGAASHLADALDRAERGGDLEAAGRFLRDLQSVWIRREDWHRVRALARRLVRLADRGGDPASQVLARYEEALAASRIGQHAEAEQLALAAGDRAARELPTLVPRGELVLGAVLSAFDLPRARVVWHQTIDAMPERPGLEPMAARAALAMADSLAEDPAAADAREQLYRLAVEVGFQAGDVGLVSAAQRGLGTL